MTTREPRRLVTLAAALVLAACGTGEGLDDDAFETTDDPPAEAEAGGTFRHGSDFEVGTWNPHFEGLAIMFSYYNPVYEALIGETPDGEPEPRLATDWELTDDRLELTLRDDVVLHDGTALDAELVRDNLLGVRDGEFPTHAASLGTVEEVEVVGDHELTLHLSAPTPQLVNTLQRQSGIIVCPDLIGDDGPDEPCGTGPWQFDAENTESGSRYAFTTFDDYHEPDHQQVDAIELHYLPDYQAAFNAIVSGDVDISTVRHSMVQAGEQQGFEVLSPRSFHLALHLLDREGEQVEALGDDRVRRAIAHAIDRDGFYESVMYGHGFPSAQRYPEGEDYHDPNVDLSYDPDRAVELLEEAGYADGFSFSIPAPSPFDIWAEAISGYLSEVGITMEIESIPPGGLVAEPASGEWPAALLPIEARHPAPIYEDRISAEGFLNPFDVATPDADDAAEAALGGNDDAWAQVMGAAAEAGVIVSLGDNSTLGMYDPDRLPNVEPMTFSPTAVNLRGLQVAGD
jgi:peptide/nickel transport system substrate-binding protein